METSHSFHLEINLLQATGVGILNIKSEMTTVYFPIRETERAIEHNQCSLSRVSKL